MSDSEQEEDYMSSKFLEGAQEYESKRKESSNYAERRKQLLREQEKKAYIKPRAQLEQEQREQGLKKSLSENEDNKGMKMLMKMGFKKGMTLGQKQTGITEPIKVDLKVGRQGIGMESEMKKRALDLEEENASHKRVELDPEDYRVMMAQKKKEARNFRFLIAAVSICEKLDEDHEVKLNILWTLKPVTPEEQNKEEGDSKHEEGVVEEVAEIEGEKQVYPEEEVQELKSLKLDQQLEKVVDYLRDKYLYCFWCRAQYNDREDLDTNCPGPEEDDH